MIEIVKNFPKKRAAPPSWMLVLAIFLAQPLFAQLDKGSRTLAIDVNSAANGDYDVAFLLAQEVGVEEVKQSLDWNSMETEVGFDFSIIDVINLYYPANQMPVSLVLRPINTNSLTLPADLTGEPLDSPEVIIRFKALLDSLYSHLSSTQITAIFIGNEIGAWLGVDTQRWEAFAVFYDSTASYVKTLWGDEMKVGTIGMLGDMTGDANRERYQQLNSLSDVIGVTYYPLNPDFTVMEPSVVAGDFADITADYPDQPLWFTEVGYPTGGLNNSSQEKQANFVTAVFEAWDTHADNIVHVDFAWMHDQDSATVAAWIESYGMSANPSVDNFGSYLATLGMRTYEGQDKLGFVKLKQEAGLRGWNQLTSIKGYGQGPERLDIQQVGIANGQIYFIKPPHPRSGSALRTLDLLGKSGELFNSRH